ncbi:hypothetical protein DPMN_088985 [Dreissena polymorpha]|uniref:Uncharacterized protein n=1 Tax=Dreissena polymorpha TaxID=45954 RepID=A0A9D4KV38_DREPO|nr:hypothetical protein DPMN_088985 [Dreissena polymorpha]
MIPTLIRDALCYDGNGHVLLSSALYFDNYNKVELTQGQVRHERAGPSRQSSIEALHTDMVVSLRCHCPGILLRWTERSRHWQPPDIVHIVERMGSFVTPVGFKGSENQHVE